MPRFLLLLALSVALTSTLSAQPKKKKILAIGAVAGFQHDSVSHALATIEQIGRRSGIYDTYIRTDTQLITKQKIAAGNAKNLDYFDAVVFYTTGELDMTPQQKKDLLSFVHDDGKGVPAITPGHGLQGMRERAARVEGAVELTSRPGGGFDVSVHIPGRSA